MKRIAIDLENEVVLEGADEIPQSVLIFTGEHIDYVDALTGNILFNDFKGRLLNIIEGAGMPERQEVAIKRQIINALHDVHRDINECLEVVRASKDCTTCRHRRHLSEEGAEPCAGCKIMSRGYVRYVYDTGQGDPAVVNE